MAGSACDHFRAAMVDLCYGSGNRQSPINRRPS